MHYSRTALALTLAGLTATANAQLEEVVVTAQKVESSLQDTPIAITAFTSDTLEALGAVNATDIGDFSPNVSIVKTFGSAGNIRTNIRGVSTGDPSLAVDPKVGLYVDGAYIARNAGAVFDIVDLERIEILRGPQGTLWGKNTTGGAINIITKKPTGEFGFKQALTFGNFGEFRSLTSVDTNEYAGLSAKLSYYLNDNDGWAKNSNPEGESDLGSIDTDAFRIALRWDINEQFSVDYAYDYNEFDAVPIPLQITHLGPGATDPGILGAFNLPDSTFYPGYNPLNEMLSVLEPDDRVERFNLDGNTVEHTEISGHNLTLVWEGDAITIKSITAYRDYESELPGNDLDGGSWTFNGESIPMFHAENEKEQDQFSQEFQFIGSALDARLDYVAGLFYFEEEGQELNPWDAMFYLNDPSRPVLLRGLGAAAGSWYAIDNESIAAYGQLKYYFNDSWDITLGLRYTEDEKKITLLDEDPRIDGPHTASDDWNKFTTDLVVGWQYSDDIRFYGKRAEGYNAGVFSLGALNHLDYTDFEVFDTPADPEEITSWEVGMKSEWLDRSLRLNVAAYFNDNENLQVTEVVNGVRTVRNSGENESYGLEVDFVSLIGAGFTLEGAYGYRKTDFDEGDDFGRSDGKHSGRLSVAWGTDTGLGYVDARIDTTYTDAQNFSSSPYGNSEDRTLIGARVGLSEIQLGDYGQLRAAIWGRNLTDEEYKEYGQDLGSNQGLGYAGNSFGTPRTYGIDITYEY
ncbi:TonB-dependent receptor [Seongchinamella unica]|uniref:TonB-dependent receptor n=1 Tax=Seongchinamella unica TaxID=2547392 RepID=A0A4R5LNE9_9GAMM|nr:TonB-dependent receptor [Seongchinamella unica]TDG11873.1 TonB-dependent receptor [Seongchinamella unica]